MNIEIANRFVELRKKNGFSQEQLAEKIGVSRQAVSKWERGEASPDTDNLILLARLYNISLDDLLKTEADIPMNEPEEAAEPVSEDDGTENAEEQKTGVHIGLSGIHVSDRNAKVDIDKTGIHISEYGGDNVNIDKNGVYVNGKHYTKEERMKENKPALIADILISLAVIMFFLILGLKYDAWHPAWLLFFIIPIIHGAASAVKHRRMSEFPYFILAVGIFLFFGFSGSWSPVWVILVTIPFYYMIAAVQYNSYRVKHIVNNEKTEQS